MLGKLWPVIGRATQVSKKEIFYLLPFGIACYLWGTLFINRQDKTAARNAINRESKAINEKKAKNWNSFIGNWKFFLTFFLWFFIFISVENFILSRGNQKPIRSDLMTISIFVQTIINVQPIRNTFAVQERPVPCRRASSVLHSADRSLTLYATGLEEKILRTWTFDNHNFAGSQHEGNGKRRYRFTGLKCAKRDAGKVWADQWWNCCFTYEIFLSW